MRCPSKPQAMLQKGIEMKNAKSAILFRRRVFMLLVFVCKIKRFLREEILHTRIVSHYPSLSTETGCFHNALQNNPNCQCSFCPVPLSGRPYELAHSRAATKFSSFYHHSQ